MDKKLIILLTFVFTLNAYTQEFSGIVTDEFGNPLPKANVYFNGSTKGVVTNNEGKFTIQIPQIQNKVLVISYMGYKTHYINDFSKNYQTYKLTPKEEALEDVMVVDANIEKDKLMTTFKNFFLGIDKNGKNCIITNEDVIKLRFDPESNTLYAHSTEDLLIINDRLNYKIRYDLLDFEVKFKSQKMKGSNMLYSFFTGTSSYEDLGDLTRRQEIARSSAFKGSIRHFFKALYHNSLMQEGFKIVKYRQSITANRVFEIQQEDEVQRLTLTDYAKTEPDHADEVGTNEKTFSFLVLYNGSEQSLIQFTTPQILINEFGDYAPLPKVLINGDMSYKKLGSMLPSDYVYE